MSCIPLPASSSTIFWWRTNTCFHVIGSILHILKWSFVMLWVILLRHLAKAPFKVFDQKCHLCISKWSKADFLHLSLQNWLYI